MATTSLVSIPLGMQNKTTAAPARSISFSPPTFRRQSTSFRRKNFPLATTAASTDSATSSTAEGTPQIELEFISPKPEADGSFKKDIVTAVSGEKLLRNIMTENKIELYATYGKVMNCGGGGSCGTCIVEIIEGKELLNEPTKTEGRYLKKKPESWRLACQTIVGNKENSGKVVVQRIPQWKK